MKKLVPEVAEEALNELKTWGIEMTAKEHVAPVDIGRVAEAVADQQPIR